MKLGLYLVGESDEFSAMGALAAQVAQHAMPGIEVWHFTDHLTRPIKGCKVSRMERRVPLAVFRMQHHQVPGEWLFTDVDVLVTQDVSPVFNDRFDIALAQRLDGDGAKGYPAFSEMPHNMGVVFSRAPEFWKAVEKELRTYDAKQQQWMGDQLAVCRLLKHFDHKILSFHYNFPPSRAGETDIITHYKGWRKQWMPETALNILNLETT